MMTHSGTVFVVDDDPAMRESLRWLLESVSLPVETFASAEEFLDDFDSARAGCLVLDVRMPGMSGLALQQELVSRGASIPVVFITAYGDIPLAVRACKAGAVDFIEKPFSDRRLLDLVREALDRDQAASAEKAELGVFAVRMTSLTAREREIMDLVVEGMTNKDMAAALGVSPRTVEVHRARLMTKLGVDSVASLVRLYLKIRRVPPPPST
jgi:FixJ family two-component response regulator